MSLSFGTVVQYVANSIPTAAINGLNALIASFRLDQFAAPTAPVDYNGQKITGIADSTTATGAASKGQMDTADAATLSSAKSYADSGDSSTLAAAKTYTDQKKAAGKYAVTITGDGSKTSFAVAHGLNTTDVAVDLYGPNGVVITDFTKTDANNIAIPLSPAPANGAAYRVIVWA